MYESKFHKDPVTEVARPRATLSGMYHNTLAISSLSLCLLSLGSSRPTSGQQLRLSLRTDLPWRKEGRRIHCCRCRGSCRTCMEVMSGRPTKLSLLPFFHSHSSHQQVWLYAAEFSDDCFTRACLGTAGRLGSCWSGEKAEESYRWRSLRRSVIVEFFLHR